MDLEDEIRAQSMNLKHRTTINMDEETHEKVMQLVNQHGVSKSAVLLIAVRRGLGLPLIRESQPYD